jgi:peptidoglycan/xylan/chitin deacetylase (PgdA/CDA1 family)
VDAAQPAQVKRGKRGIGPLFLALLLTAAAGAAEPARLKVALTFDDLPLNGALPLGARQSDFARATLAVMAQHRVPPSYGFINADKLERNPDGALALKLWIEAGHPLANHTYNHLDLTKNSAEAFQREILRNEPVLELLTLPGHDWRWFRYPYLHEGDTLEKRRAVRGFLENHGYRIAQTTLDFEDYMWNSAHARCWAKQDEAAIRWLRESYLATAQAFLPFQRGLSREVFGRDIHHVLLLHLGSFSSHILPDLLELLDRQGFEIVTLEEAHSDPIYLTDPDAGDPHGGTLIELVMQAKKMPWPQNAPTKPRERLTSICK